MSSAPSPPYNPLLPPAPGTGFRRIGDASIRSDTNTPVELTAGTCRFIETAHYAIGSMAVIDIILTTRIVAAGASTNHSVDVNLSQDAACTVGVNDAYPYNLKIYEPPGVTAGVTLYESSEHYIVTIVDRVLPAAVGIYLSWVGAGATHRVWYDVAGYTLDR